MFPILFSVGSLTIHSYGAFIALGYLSTVFITNRLAARAGLPPSFFTATCFYALIAGLLGSRLLFVATQWTYFSVHKEEMFLIWQGGMVFYGGFIAGFAAALINIWLAKLSYWACLDILAVALPVGQAFGRLGCFAAGCCHGSACALPWAVTIDSELVDASLRGIPIHPVQIYELGLLLFLALGLYIVWRRGAIAGTVTLLYCAGYSILRFFIENFRGDNVRGFVRGGPLSTSQAIALVILLMSGACYLLMRYRRRVCA
jgi:phosphatidylglycerol:prolipoprotein diacylglycerol transferase